MSDDKTFWSFDRRSGTARPEPPGPQCFLGYVDATLDADAFDQEGWLRTGDLGLVDASGNVGVTGRIKDAIFRNAANVSALEIENVLAAHPAVADIAVI